MNDAFKICQICLSTLRNIAFSCVFVLPPFAACQQMHVSILQPCFNRTKVHFHLMFWFARYIFYVEGALCDFSVWGKNLLKLSALCALLSIGRCVTCSWMSVSRRFIFDYDKVIETSFHLVSLTLSTKMVRTLRTAQILDHWVTIISVICSGMPTY